MNNRYGFAIQINSSITRLLYNDPLGFVIETLDELIVGEKSNKITLFLSKISYLTDNPTHELILGNSSAGKTWLVDQVLSLFPPEDIIKFTRTTKSWLDYMGDKFKNKIVYAQQLGSFQSHSDSIQILLSEKGLTLHKVQATADGLQPQKLNIEGPISFVSTSAEHNIDNQIQTRTHYLSPDESEEQTNAIQHFQALDDKYPWNKEEKNENVNLIRDLIRHIKTQGVKDVVIPFSDLIILPSSSVRVRRDRPKLIELIKSLAMLRQWNRKVIEKGGFRYVVTEWEDFQDIVRLCGPIIGQTISRLNATEEKTLSTIQRVYTSKQTFSAQDLSKNLEDNLAVPTIRGYLNSLNDKGYLDCVKGGGKSKKNLYSIIPGYGSPSAKLLKELEKIDNETVRYECNIYFESIKNEVLWLHYDENGELIPSKEHVNHSLTQPID